MWSQLNIHLSRHWSLGMSDWLHPTVYLFTYLRPILMLVYLFQVSAWEPCNLYLEALLEWCIILVLGIYCVEQLMLQSFPYRSLAN